MASHKNDEVKTSAVELVLEIMEFQYPGITDAWKPYIGDIVRGDILNNIQ